MADDRLRHRTRIGLAWGFTALLIAVYFALPGGDENAGSAGFEPASPAFEAPPDTQKLEVIHVSPADIPPGGAFVITYGGTDDTPVRVFAGKDELAIVAKRPGSLVARLPAGLGPGRTKIRLRAGNLRGPEEVSGPYEIRVKAANWRKPFRNLVGSLALLVFGIGVFGRGAREAIGLRGAHRLARFAERGPAALAFGALVGTLVQSTAAAAGFLAGLVTSSLLAVAPAAAAFLGAQLGAAAAPLLVTGVLDPHGAGLLAIAIGVLWLALANDRRATSFGRLVLGAGLIAFALQSLRPGLEPFVSDPTLLSVADRLNAESPLGVAACALLGAALVALLQGPAPVIVLVLGFAQTTGHWDLRTALAMLSGTGLGAALGALVTTPVGPAGKRLAQTQVILGAGSTLLAASTVALWARLSDWLVAGAPHEVQWGKRLLLPKLGQHLGVAFGLSQLATVLVLLPLVPLIARLVHRLMPDEATPAADRATDEVVVRSGLLGVLRAQRAFLEPLSELALTGMRGAGRTAEHHLADAQATLESLLAGPVRRLSLARENAALGRAAFASLQLERALEDLLRQAERLTDGRVAASAKSPQAGALPGAHDTAVREMQALFSEGLEALASSLEMRAPVDLESARAREIRMNGFEARAREALLTDDRSQDAVKHHLGVLELVDAFETAGNQLYRLSEALGEVHGRPSFSAVV